MSETKSEATRIRLTPQERAALEAAALSHGGNVSEAMRRAVRAMYMAEPPGNRQAKNEGSAATLDKSGASPLCAVLTNP